MVIQAEFLADLDNLEPRRVETGYVRLLIHDANGPGVARHVPTTLCGFGTPLRRQSDG